MTNSIRIRLSMMMFLQFFIWGGWFVTLGTFLVHNLRSSDAQVGTAFSTQSWGAIIAPFIVGLIADRFINAEKILAVLHLLGAVLLYQMYLSNDFGRFYPLVLAYMILYMPTLALVNTVAFRQTAGSAKEFSLIRVWGTIGWIASGLLISYLFAWDSQEAIRQGLLKNTFFLCAVASAVLGIFSFILPKTPPVILPGHAIKWGDIVGLDALKLLRDRNFSVFFVSSILICIPLAFYYQNANPFLTESGMENATGKMTLGQLSEIFFMLLLPTFLHRFGIKKTLLLGMLAWVVRYALFAYGDTENRAFMLIMGIALHGICYDFFFVSGQIYTDDKAGKMFKSSAQGMITLATYGFGMLIGFQVAGWISGNFVTNAGHNWQTIWLFPSLFALTVLVFFAVDFKSEVK